MMARDGSGQGVRGKPLNRIVGTTDKTMNTACADSVHRGTSDREIYIFVK
jgi:hypothetical protein